MRSLACYGAPSPSGLGPGPYTNRKGWVYGPPIAKHGPVVAVDGPRARVNYPEVTVLFDGSPSDAPHRVTQIAKARDQWERADPNERKAIQECLEAFKRTPPSR
jgi:hypothetical protein